MTEDEEVNSFSLRVQLLRATVPLKPHPMLYLLIVLGVFGVLPLLF